MAVARPLWIVLAASSLFLGACARFRTHTLSPEKIFSVSLTDGKLHYPRQNGIYHEIPSRLGVLKDWVVLSEPSEKTVRIFRAAKQVASITAGAKQKTETKNPDVLRIPGRVVMGVSDDFFVESYFPPDSEGANALDRGSYKILHYDLKGKYLHTIGRKGLSELAFENLLWFDADTKGYLWVLYRYLDELHLDRYEGTRLAYEFRQTDCENVMLDKKQIQSLKEKNSVIHCEYMYPFYSGERLLLASRVDRIDSESEKKQLALAYRIVKVKNLSEPAAETVFARLTNAEDHPYLPQGRDGVGLWQNLEPGRVRIGRYSLGGDLRNSLILETSGNTHEWRKVWQTLGGEFYGIRIFADQFEIHQFR